MFHRKLSSVSRVLLCKSNWQKLKNMKNKPNNTHSQWGYLGEPHTFSQPCENVRALPLGEIGVDGRVPCPFKVFTFERRQQSSGACDSCNAQFRIPYRLRQTKKRSNTIFHVDDNIRAIVPFFFFLSLLVSHES